MFVLRYLIWCDGLSAHAHGPEKSCRGSLGTEKFWEILPGCRRQKDLTPGLMCTHKDTYTTSRMLSGFFYSGGGENDLNPAFWVKFYAPHCVLVLVVGEDMNIMWDMHRSFTTLWHRKMIFMWAKMTPQVTHRWATNVIFDSLVFASTTVTSQFYSN